MDIERVVDVFTPGRSAHVVKDGALIAESLRTPHDLVIGRFARVTGSVEAEGRIHLAQGAAVGGNVTAKLDIVLGAGASVAGNVTSEGRIHLLRGALVAGTVRAAGDVHVHPGVRCDLIACDGDLHLSGPAETGTLDVKGRLKVG